MIARLSIPFGVLSGSNSAVECNLAKVDVAGSIPVSRSNSSENPPGLRPGFHFQMNWKKGLGQTGSDIILTPMSGYHKIGFPGDVAKWLRQGPAKP